jgi:hypothetical protein
LLEVGSLGFFATTAISLGGAFIGASFEIEQNLELSQGVPKDVEAHWQAKEADAFLFGFVLIGIAIVAAAFGGAKVLSIIRSTEHLND